MFRLTLVFDYQLRSSRSDREHIDCPGPPTQQPHSNDAQSARAYERESSSRYHGKVDLINI